MLYDLLKIFHIISATFVLTSMAYSYYLWRSMQSVNWIHCGQRIQNQTIFFIVPFALLQLGTGFTMISLQQSSFLPWWIGGSLLSFIVALLSWFGFIYFLLPSPQVTEAQPPVPIHHYRRRQSFMLLCCAFGLLSMVFFMANKTALNQGLS